MFFYTNKSGDDEFFVFFAPSRVESVTGNESVPIQLAQSWFLGLWAGHFQS